MLAPEGRQDPQKMPAKETLFSKDASHRLATIPKK